MATLACWNVNSIRARLPVVLSWVAEHQPDILLLQETKTVDEGFPAMEFEDLGYNLALHGQKSYNGVAILSRYPLSDVRRGLPGDDADDHARYIEALVEAPEGPVRCVSVYVPNGQMIGSDKFRYKLGFYCRMKAHLAELLDYREATIVGGDYNVAPFAIDVHDPKRLEGTVGFHPEERKHLRSLINLGYYDAFRAKHPDDAHEFSWWDYRDGSWAMNKGMRIDLLLASPQAMDRIDQAWTEKTVRGVEKASDHAPICCTIA